MAILGMTRLTCHTKQYLGGNALGIALVNVLCLNVYKLACARGRTRVGPTDCGWRVLHLV